MIPTAATTSVPVAPAVLPEPSTRTTRTPRFEPLADVTGAIASACTVVRDGRRGIEVAVEGVARLRVDDVSAHVAAVVFVPATAPQDETRDIVARELARAATSVFGTLGRTLPHDRISITLR